MISRYLFVTVFICIFNGRYSFCARPSLETILTSTTDFFEQLKLNYESQPATPELFESIDNQLADYVKKVKNSTNSSREKRQLDLGKEVGILNGFEKVPSLDLPNAIDVTFFVHRHGTDVVWYAAALNPSGISLMQYQGHSFSRVGSYPDLYNGTRIISHSCESAILLVVQTSIGEAIVIRLSHENSKYTLHRVQTLNVPAASHATLWQGMKQIYFAVASQKNFTVFNWLGEHFDRIQNNNLDAKRLIPFQTGGSMHLIATNGPRTSILKFLLRSRKFVVVQKLVGAKDATAFHLEKGHMGEHFIALAGQSSTVIYKQSKHRFVPFQEVSGAEEIRSFTNEAAVLLILMKKEEITIYQYDGWKFAESSVRAVGVFDVVPLTFQGDELLALKLRDPRFEDIFRTDRTSPVASTNRTIAPSRQISGHASEESKDWTSKFWQMDNFGENASSWIFQRVKWRRRKTWASLREETKIWCLSSLDKTLRVAATVPKIEGPVRIGRGFIKNLRAREVNGQSAEKFGKLTDRWNTIIDETGRQERAVKNYVTKSNPTFENLRAGTVRVNCTTMCRATRTETAVKNEFLKRLRRIDNVKQDLEFRNVRVSVAKNLRCPIPALEFRDATVSGLVNGIRFPAFVEDVLKVTGDQELTGSHTFAKLRVANAKISLDVASHFTRQDIQTKSVKIDELNINAGGLLLPLNGNVSVMSGSLTVRKAKINGLIDIQRGRIRGKGADFLSPMVYITEPLEFSGNFSLRNVKILESLEVKDLTRPVGKTFKKIASNALPLSSSHVPIHFKFRNDKVSWKNMTLRNFPYKWVTKKHCGHLIITGTKQATMPRVVLGKSAYSNLPTPRLPLRLCARSIVTEGIWQSNLVIDRGSAKSVKSINVFDESELSEVFLESATSLNEVRWSLKNLTGRITVKNANIGKIVGMDYEGLNRSIARWLEPGHLKGPINVKNLKVNNVIAPVGFKMSLPPEVGNAKSTENIFVGKWNGVDFNQFLDNVVRIEDTISLTNVTFAGGLVATEIFASETSFSLQEKVTLGYLGSKEIIGTLASEAMIVPHVLQFPSSNTPVNIVTNGSVRFISEPSIVNVNDKNLGRLYDKIWMADRTTTISAEFVEFKTVSFQNDLTILKSFDTPSLGPWDGIENRLLSKTRSQTINVSASFSSIEAPNVFGAAKSHLRSNVSYLNDLEFNSLKKNNTQVIKNNWKFEELIITGNANLRGRINKLNLATDIVRYDVGSNVITGKKIVHGVIARNILGIARNGLKFDEFARNALRMNNGNRTIVIKGWKSFKTVQLPYTRVDGTIMGSRIENSLLKSSTQTLRGSKVFQGTLRTPEIITNGTVNNMNLKYFIAYQLKKRANSQIIKTPILLSNNLTIMGNVTIDGLYQGVELRNFKSSTDSLESVVKKTSELLNFAEGIDVALENRAVYWDKLELLERNSTPLITNPVKNELMQLDGLGRCRIDVSSLYCNDKRVVNFLSNVSNGTRLLQARVVTLPGISLAAYITSDPEGGVFILRFDRNENRFRQVTALRVPGIVAGSFTTTMDCLWISLRLRDHIMILRYELWARDFQEWILPGSGAFLMSSTPTEELLILRSDGVWKLGGLAGPRHVFRATLNGQIDTFSFEPDYYVQLTDGNVTTLLKTRYIGN